MSLSRISITNFHSKVKTNQIKSIFNKLNIGNIVSTERISAEKIIAKVNWNNNKASIDIYNNLHRPDSYVYIHDKPIIWSLKLLTENPSYDDIPDFDLEANPNLVYTRLPFDWLKKNEKNEKKKSWLKDAYL